MSITLNSKTIRSTTAVKLTGSKSGKRHVPEKLPPRGAVDAGRLEHLPRHRLQPSQQHHQEEGDRVPGVDQQQRKDRPPPIGEERDVLEPESSQETRQRAPLRIHDRAPDHPAGGDRTHHERQQEHDPEQLPPPDLLVQQQGQPERDHVLERNADPDEQEVVLQRIPEPPVAHDRGEIRQSIKGPAGRIVQLPIGEGDEDAEDGRGK
jgi:hypothetical protein